VGYFAKAIVYHYNRDGILVGPAGPGAPAAGVSGWLNNTASIACNRDPRDGKIDVFAEEDYAHRPLTAIPNYARLNRIGRLVVWIREQD